MSQECEILLIEDNPSDLELTLRALRMPRMANHIQVARDGAEALEYLFHEGVYAKAETNDSPKLVLLDLKLPKIDGLEVLLRIKQDPRTKAIPVVILSSSNEQSDIIESYKLGVNSYIVKPFDFTRFASAVESIGTYWMQLNQHS